MKLFTFDDAWRGAVAVLADSLDEAKKIVADEISGNFDPEEQDWTETELVEANNHKLILVCTGDQ